MALQGMVDDYNTFMDELESAIQSALYGTMRDELIESIAKSARKNVYSYKAQPFFMEQRRYEIADPDNFSSLKSYGTTLVLENREHLRNGEAGEVDIVESGDSRWHQPGPRPFMEEGLQNYVDSGQAERDLKWELAHRGFTVRMF